MESKQPILVSIIIPCHNVENCVARAINSALAQTYVNTEIICIDNNSTDGTLEVLKDYCQKYPGKIQVHEELERGAPAARNLGVRYARGEWLQFLDADDEIFPEKIYHQVAIIEKEPDSSIIINACHVISPDGIQSTLSFEMRNVLLDLFFSNLGNTLANLWRKDILEAVGGWNNSFEACQEDELLLRLLNAGAKIVSDSTILSVIHQRRDSISYASKAYYKYGFQLRSLIYNHLKQDDSLSVFEKEINQRFFSIIKMYSIVCPEKGIAAFKAYFPKLYPVSSPFEGGLFYLLARFLGYRVAVWALRVLR